MNSVFTISMIGKVVAYVMVRKFDNVQELKKIRLN